MSPPRSLLLSSATLLASACGSDLPDKPVGPDMDALVAAYDSPTAALDQTVADELAVQLRDHLGITDSLAAVEEEVRSLLEDVFEEEEAAASTRRRGEEGEAEDQEDEVGRQITLEGDGFAIIERVCAGWGPEPTVDEDANGSLRLTATFTEAGIDPVIWGELDGCRELIEGFQVRADGGINVHTGAPLSLSRLGETPLLFQLLAEIEVDGEELPGQDLDFRLCPPGAAECRPGTVEAMVERADGTHLNFLFDIESPDQLSVLAANGEWACAFDSADASCSDPSGASVSFREVLP